MYCSGLNLSAQSSLTLNPGVYIVKNGISLGGQTSINGNGVFIYMMTGGVTMAGGAVVNLTAAGAGVGPGSSSTKPAATQRHPRSWAARRSS